jgi:hypothetical protein
MWFSVNGPPAAYNVGDAQYSAEYFYLLNQLGVNGYRSNLPTGSLDSERATRWANALGTTNLLTLDFLLSSATERPNSATINTRVQAGVLFVEALIAGGVPEANIIVKAPNEPQSTLSTGNPDAALFTVCENIQAAFKTYMPAGVLTGSPTFFGSNDDTDFVGANIGEWAVVGQSLSWDVLCFNTYPAVPFGNQIPAAYGASVAHLINNQILLLHQVFGSLPVYINETAPYASALTTAYNPVTYVEYQLACLKAIPLPGHINNGGLGFWGALSTVNTEPTGNIETDGMILLNGSLSTTGKAMLQIATAVV